MRLDQLSPVAKGKRTIRVVIETPKGSRHKYAFDPELGAFVLRKSLPRGMVFPFDFGFIPGSKGGDGDPLDVLVLADDALFPGCVLECRLIGVIEAEQREAGKTTRNDRFIGIPATSQDFRDIVRPQDLSPHILEQTEQFFVTYNQLLGKIFRPLRVLGPQLARKKLSLNENQKSGPKN